LGVVYVMNDGGSTESVANSMIAFDPDSRWGLEE